MDILLVTLYLILGLFIAASLSTTIKVNKTWSISIWVQIWLAIYYVIIPVFMIVLTHLNGNYPGRWPNIIFKDSDFVNFNTFLATTLFFVAFYLSLSFKFSRYNVFPLVLKIGSIKLMTSKTMVILFLFFGLFSLVYYVNGLDGFSNAFRIAPYIASPYYEEEYSKLYSGTFTMFKRFIPFVVYSALFFPFFKSRWSKFFFVFIPIIAYIFFTFLERQRQMTIVLFVVPIIGYMIEKRLFVNKKFIISVGVILLIFPVITFFNKAFVYDSKSFEVVTGWFNAERYIKEFNFPQISLWISQNANYDKFWFTDFYSGIYGNYLPTSMKEFQTVNDLNSFYFEGKESRSFPPGIIGNSFYHLGYLGVILWGFIVGFIVNVFDLFWDSILQYDRRFAYAYAFTFMSFFAFIRTGVLGYSLYRPFFVFLIVTLLMSFILKSSLLSKSDDFKKMS